MVGTHFPEERDVFQSALQRMREAFEGLRDGQLTAGLAEDLFHSGYDEVLDVASVWFASRRSYPAQAGGS